MIEQKVVQTNVPWPQILKERTCSICQLTSASSEVYPVRSNVRKFRDEKFWVWRCRYCNSLECEAPITLDRYYKEYPIRNQQLDYFSRSWYKNILDRLKSTGLETHHSILDYGCNQGLFLNYLKEQGYKNCFGYDPYMPKFQSQDILQESAYNFVISIDVIEHDSKPKDFLGHLKKLVRPGGIICVETPNADGISLQNSEKYLHAIHVPYHLHILSEGAFYDLARGVGLTWIKTYHRWYMNSWWPGTSRKLIEELLLQSGNDLDAGYEPPQLKRFLRHPMNIFYLFFGYLIPDRKNDHMMLMFKSE